MCINIIVVCVSTAATKASEPPVTVAELAKITGYPAEKIKVVDGTDESNARAERKKYPKGLSHHYYSSDDDTFASVSVAIGRKGTLLTPELDARAKEVIEKAALNPTAPVKIRPISFGEGVHGYSGLGMAGGGGSMDRSVVSIPDHDRDIQITIIFGENALTPLKGAELYQNAVITSDGVNAIIDKCLTLVSNKILSSSSAVDVSPPLESITTPQPSAPKKPIDQNSGLPAPVEESPASTRWPLLAVVVVAALGLLWLWLKKRK